jgi:DNA-binding response OmpR family regulator
VKVGVLCNTNEFTVYIVLESCAHATSSLEMDLAAGIVTRCGTHVGLTPTGYPRLEILARHSCRLVSQTQLVKAV